LGLRMRVVSVLQVVVLAAAAWSVGWIAVAWVSDRAWLAPVGILSVLSAYALALAAEFAWLRRHHGEADPPPIARLLKAWAIETALGPWIFGWRQPFRHASVENTAASNRRGVLLVHGYFCNRAMWAGWLPRFARDGIPCVAVDLDPAFVPIRRYAAALDGAVHRLTVACGGRPPVVVAHSMGGVAVRAWLAGAGPDARRRVHRVVTIGSPHRGTWLARFAGTPNGRDMRIGSELLATLDATESPELRAAFVCFWSDCDNVVFPSAHATLTGADNRKIEGWAHVHLVEHPAIVATVRAALDERDQMS
jgi:triacylglycerol lipase